MKHPIVRRRGPKLKSARPVRVRLSKPLYLELVKRARESQISYSWCVRKMIEDALVKAPH